MRQALGILLGLITLAGFRAGRRGVCAGPALVGLLLLIAGCTHTEVYTDARTWQSGVGLHYTRSTSITATDAKTTDVSPQTQLDLPIPIKSSGGRYIVSFPDLHRTITVDTYEQAMAAARLGYAP